MSIKVQGDLNICVAQDLRQDLIILRSLLDPAGGEGGPESVAREGLDTSLHTDLLNVTVKSILTKDLSLCRGEQEL